MTRRLRGQYSNLSSNLAHDRRTCTTARATKHSTPAFCPLRHVHRHTRRSEAVEPIFRLLVRHRPTSQGACFRQVTTGRKHNQIDWLSPRPLGAIFNIFWSASRWSLQQRRAPACPAASGAQQQVHPHPAHRHEGGFPAPIPNTDYPIPDSCLALIQLHSACTPTQPLILPSPAARTATKVKSRMTSRRPRAARRFFCPTPIAPSISWESRVCMCARRRANAEPVPRVGQVSATLEIDHICAFSSSFLLSARRTRLHSVQMPNMDLRPSHT